MRGLRLFGLCVLPFTLLAASPSLPHDVEALLRRGRLALEAGHQHEAVAAFERVRGLAEQTGDRRLLLQAKIGLGAICTCARRAAEAERNLREGLTLAQELGDTNAVASLRTNLGNLFAALGRSADALAEYQHAGTVAAEANAAAVAKQGAAELNERALGKLAGQPLTLATAMVWLRCGQTDLLLGETNRAERAFREALKFEHPKVQTYAWGYLGQLTKSVDWLRQAAFIAQEQSLPEALYRWEWQIGRLHAAAGKRAEAIAAYRRAVETLQPIRAELTQGCGAARPTFREAVAPVYYELADLLLRGDDFLVEARDIIEQLKSAELDDYLQDECAGTRRDRTSHAEIEARTAVIHVIPLADRTEVLLGFRKGLERVRLPVTAEKLTATVRKFRANLERRTSNQYLVEAEELYQMLVAPLRTSLAKHQTETLVLVPDGALRTIPFGALYDGKHFLIEQFAVAVTPGVTLMEAYAMTGEKLGALAAGLAKGTQQFAPLPGVPDELRTVAGVFQSPVLLDEQFTSAALRRDFARQQFQVVHFATHGQVDKDVTKSFILTHDGRLTLDELETLLRPGQFRGRPVELLTLSACQTAAGDDRAALGLAGVAVKAGARSALATLWFVNDESTTLLMQEFYRAVRSESKAKALQRAQLKVLRDPRFEHAGYWAAYLLIGNWL